MALTATQTEIELPKLVTTSNPSSSTPETIERGLPTTPDSSSSTPQIDEFQDNSQVPRLSPLRLFWFFFSRFGLFAWGGPVAQIALIKEQLVIKHKWITIARFNRAFAVYQILPGPEAAELCMFFGCLSGGRLGGIMAGLGFVLPGFLLMMGASYIYVLVGFENIYVNASFRALQPLVAAMV
jgi:chromate transport protein ChrA